MKKLKTKSILACAVLASVLAGGFGLDMSRAEAAGEPAIPVFKFKVNDGAEQIWDVTNYLDLHNLISLNPYTGSAKLEVWGEEGAISNNMIVGDNGNHTDLSGNVLSGLTVIFNSGTVNGVYGRYSTGGKDLNGETVIINGGIVKGSSSGISAAGVLSLGDGNANNGTLNINGGTFYKHVSGGYTGGGDANNNIVNITDGMFMNEQKGYMHVYGGSAKDNANNNQVNISGGYGNTVYGGEGGQSANNNQVNISGGEYESVWGGHSSQGNAQNNIVRISGGKIFIRGTTINSAKIVGGWASHGVASNNKVILSGGDLSTADVYGWYYANTHSDNTLQIENSVSVSSVNNFENLNFVLQENINDNDTMLALSNGVSLGSEAVNVYLNGQERAAITLIDKASGSLNNDKVHVYTGAVGNTDLSNNYTVTIADNQLILKNKNAITWYQVGSEEKWFLTGTEAQSISDVNGDVTIIRGASTDNAYKDINVGSHKLTVVGADNVNSIQVNGNLTAGELKINDGKSFQLNGSADVGQVTLGAGASVIATGDFSGGNMVSVGKNNTMQALNTVALGSNAVVSGANSVAIGNNSVASEANTVSVGKSGAERRIVNVANGMDDHDAVNKGQLNATQTELNARIDMTGAMTEAKAEIVRDALNQRINPYITDSGLSANSLQIKNLADGTADTDAATVGQVKTTVGSLAFNAETKKLTYTNLGAESATEIDLSSLAGSGTGTGGDTVVGTTNEVSVTDGTGDNAGKKVIGLAESVKTQLTNSDTHIDNNDIHVTAEQKTTWSNKQDALNENSELSIKSLTTSGNVTVGGYVSGTSGTIDTATTNKYFVTGGAVYTALQSYATKTDLGDYAKLSGANFTGAVTSNKGTGADDFANNEFVTKAWVMANVSAGGTGGGDTVVGTDEVTVTDGTGDNAGKKVIGLSENVKTTLAQVETNKTNIETNATNIATNTADIATNTANIATNADNIAANTTAIGTNTANIADLQTAVDGKADKATTLAGYGIGDAYTKSEVYSKAEVTDLISQATSQVVVADDKTAFGQESSATGNNATAVGSNNTVSGNKSTAVGYGNIVSGVGSGAFGDPNEVSGSGSYAVGNDNTISGNNSFVLGNNVNVTSQNSIVLGNDSADGGNNTVSVGSETLQRKIVNVADGEYAHDAATYGQLERTAGQLSSQIDRMGTRISKVGAGAAALAAMHPVYDPESKLTFSAGVGNYKSETAAAVGLFYRFDDRVMLNFGASVGNDNDMYNMGLNFALGRHTPKGMPTRQVMYQQLISLQTLLNEQKAENAAMKQENNDMRQKMLEQGVKMAAYDAKVAAQDVKIEQLTQLVQELLNR